MLASDTSSNRHLSGHYMHANSIKMATRSHRRVDLLYLASLRVRHYLSCAFTDNSLAANSAQSSVPFKFATVDVLVAFALLVHGAIRRAVEAIANTTRRTHSSRTIINDPGWDAVALIWAPFPSCPASAVFFFPFCAYTWRLDDDDVLFIRLFVSPLPGRTLCYMTGGCNVWLAKVWPH